MSAGGRYREVNLVSSDMLVGRPPSSMLAFKSLHKMVWCNRERSRLLARGSIVGGLSYSSCSVLLKLARLATLGRNSVPVILFPRRILQTEPAPLKEPLHHTEGSTRPTYSAVSIENRPSGAAVLSAHWLFDCTVDRNCMRVGSRARCGMEVGDGYDKARNTTHQVHSIKNRKRFAAISE
jgi:hypothetical protein